MSKRKSQTDWKRVKAIGESDPIPYSPEDGPYDPNDAKAAQAYLSTAIIRRPGQRGKQGVIGDTYFPASISATGR